MDGKKSDSFAFWPDAMLPAWVVTDQHLVVRHQNNFAIQLLGAVGKSELFFNELLSLRLDALPSERHESLWKCILDSSQPKNLDYVRESLRMLGEHVAILDDFSQMDEAESANLLVEQLKHVTAAAGMEEAVTPYIYRPLVDIDDPEFAMGIKVSPPQGLKLIRPVELATSVVEYVDIVMAYRLRSDWTFDRKLRRVSFHGTQPAIHDATVRHRLWERARLEEQAEVTQFLSHAFKTPISNIQSMVRELRCTGLSDYYQDLCEKLEAQVSDLSNLSDLILFINTSEPIPTTLCASQPADAIVWEYVSLDEVRDEIEQTLQSIHKGRTRDPQNKKKVELLARLDGDAGASRNHETLDYSKLARTILDVKDMAGYTTFGLLLPPGRPFEEYPEKAAEVAKKARTTFLNLLLVELFLNAVKYSDPAAPSVKVRFSLNAANDRLEISVINNGIALSASEFTNALKELANKPGEKRRALGLLLNLRAAEILGCELEWKEPAQPGTHLVLSIPFRK